MKIKVFTTDKNGNITLTKKELEEILNEAYWDGYSNGSKSQTYTWSTPWSTPYYTWTTTTAGNSSLTIGSDTADFINNSTISKDNITINTPISNADDLNSYSNNTKG